MVEKDDDEPCNPYMTNPPCWGCEKLLNGCDRVWTKNNRGGYDIKSPFELCQADPEFAKRCGIDYTGTCVVCGLANNCKLLSALTEHVMVLNKTGGFLAEITLRGCKQFTSKK